MTFLWSSRNGHQVQRHGVEQVPRSREIGSGVDREHDSWPDTDHVTEQQLLPPGPMPWRWLVGHRSITSGNGTRRSDPLLEPQSCQSAWRDAQRRRRDGAQGIFIVYLQILSRLMSEINAHGESISFPSEDKFKEFLVFWQPRYWFTQWYKLSLELASFTGSQNL